MFDSTGTVERFPDTVAEMHLKKRIAQAISAAYHAAMPWACALALVGFLIAAILRRGPGLEIYGLAAGSLAAIGCRLGLLAFLDATSIPSVNILYASPATPFVIVFAVTGIYAGWTALAGRFGGMPVASAFGGRQVRTHDVRGNDPTASSPESAAPPERSSLSIVSA